MFSITFAWTSTPGIVTPKGVLTKSNSPWADAPIKTYLSLNFLLSNFPSNTELADMYWLFCDFLYLIQIIPFGSEEI